MRYGLVFDIANNGYTDQKQPDAYAAVRRFGTAADAGAYRYADTDACYYARFFAIPTVSAEASPADLLKVYPKANTAACF